MKRGHGSFFVLSINCMAGKKLNHNSTLYLVVQIDRMAFIINIVRWLTQKCDSCGSDVQGDYINHPTFGTVRTCCARASQ